MSGRTTGSCVCGSVSVACNPSDVKVGVHCYCTNCQKLTGSGKSSNVLLDADKVSLQGSLNRHSMEGDSGKQWTHVCCKQCGASIAMINEHEAEVVLRAGILDDSSWVTFISIFTRSATSWDSPETEIQFEGAVPAHHQG